MARCWPRAGRTRPSSCGTWLVCAAEPCRSLLKDQLVAAGDAQPIADALVLDQDLPSSAHEKVASVDDRQGRPFHCFRLLSRGVLRLRHWPTSVLQGRSVPRINV